MKTVLPRSSYLVEASVRVLFFPLRVNGRSKYEENVHLSMNEAVYGKSLTKNVRPIFRPGPKVKTEEKCTSSIG